MTQPERIYDALDGARRAGWAKYYEAEQLLDDYKASLNNAIWIGALSAIRCYHRERRSQPEQHAVEYLERASQWIRMKVIMDAIRGGYPYPEDIPLFEDALEFLASTDWPYL